jgi:excisionase family DNA binding protein
MAQDRWLTTGQVAALLGVSRSTVTRWIRDGKLAAHAISVGARPTYRVRETDLRAFVRQYVRALG